MQIEATPSLNDLLSHIFDKGPHPIDIFLEKEQIAFSYGVMVKNGTIVTQSEDYIDFMSRLDAILCNTKIKNRVILDCENLLKDYPKLIINL